MFYLDVSYSRGFQIVQSNFSYHTNTIFFSPECTPEETQGALSLNRLAVIYENSKMAKRDLSSPASHDQEVQCTFVPTLTQGRSFQHYEAAKSKARPNVLRCSS